ncbi:ubiquitin-specific protease otu1 [Coemansia sp. RSA 2708]|nr:ubiquitin-specific protease otu1 [Coemansia sp. RSA 2708]
MTLNLSKDGQSSVFPYHAKLSTFGQFKDYLALVTELPRHEILVKLGHPPTVLDYPDHTLLSDTPIHSGSEVTVALRPQQSAPALPTIPLEFCRAPLSHIPNTPFQPAGDFIAVGDGYLVRRKVPGDNSCLFSSLASCLGNPHLTPTKLRELVAQIIKHSPQTFSAAVLERPVDEYCAWIVDPSSWGGGIEMAAISEAFHVEICSIDTRTQRVDRFGESRYARRVFLLYTGSHYDYIAFAARPDDPREFDQTDFLVSAADADAVLATAIALAAKL